MAADELQAAFEVLYSHLNGANALWGQNVTSEQVASAKLEKPCVQFFLAGGGNELVSPNLRNARLTLSVKGIAYDMATARAIKAALGDLLEAGGTQDVAPKLPAHADWEITTVTMDRIISLDEKFEGAQSIYHRGNQYVLTMERL